MTGGVFTGVTVNTKESVATLVPSVTNTVMVAEPNCPAAGVNVTVRLLPLPPKTMLFVGTRVGLEEFRSNIRLPSGVSESVMMNGIAAVGTFEIVVWLGMSLIVGAEELPPVVATSKLHPPEIDPVLNE